MRVPAGDIEAFPLDRLRAFFSSRTDIGDALAPLDLEARAFDAALRSAFTLSKRWLAMPPVEMKSLVLDNCRTGNHCGQSDRHLAEPRENRRGAGSGRR